MPIPRHSAALPSVQLPVEAECGGVTELRVHGVGGSPPDAILGDLAPEQVSGDAIAGFYSTSDHRASNGDRDAHLDVDRHVEVYSWGGLTSQSKVRVLWLALLPFLFGNLAGWMCSATTRDSTWKFRLHRLAAGLGALALIWLASKTWRYEAVRPPYHVTATRKAEARKVTAAAVKAGLADVEFWDGEGSVRLLTGVHLAVVVGFL